MSPYVSRHLEAIKDLCRKFYLRELWLFGSALRDGFSPQSDIDFLYELAHQHLDGKQSIEAFLGFEQALRTLLDREIELVWYTGIRNPYFKAEVDEQKVLIYDQKAEKVSV